MRTSFQTYIGRQSDLPLFQQNPKAKDALFFSTDSGIVYLLNEANEVIQVLGPEHTKETYVEKKTHLTNCKNCGAVLTSNKCEYCGTIY